MTELRLPEPTSMTGASWTVFELLANEEERDPTSMARMSDEQRTVFTINMLRQEVNSGGFDSYFLSSSGDTAPIAAKTIGLLGPRWSELVNDAMALFDQPYPVDPDVRRDRIDTFQDELDALDQRLYELESSTEADSKLDDYVASHRSAFFKPPALPTR